MEPSSPLLLASSSAIIGGMNLAKLLDHLDAIAPTRYAESWDNVGLLAGDQAQEITRAILAIDYSPAVAQEAYAARSELVISYHPPIFDAMKRLTAPSLVFDAIRMGMAIYSPHTALDVADGGTNDVLAEILGIKDPAPLRGISPSPWHYKLITFAPHQQADKVADALFDAGAGSIGNYSRCSFRSDGTGTFLGDEGTHPTVGRPGELERADETRIETIVPAGNLTAVVNALRQSHPYEEPAFDIVQLTTPPENRGMGKLGKIDAIDRAKLIDKVKAALGQEHLLVAGPTSGIANSAACCAGACGSMVNDAIAQKADVLLTGEMRHHDALKAAAAGMTVICALHSNSERITLPRYARRIAEASGIEVLVSRQDRDPFTIL